jgi:hypothetical protein
MIQLQTNLWQSNKPTKAFRTQKCLIFQVYKAFNNVMT